MDPAQNYGYLILVFIICMWWGLHMTVGTYGGQKRALDSSPGAGVTSSWKPHGEGAGNLMGVFCKSGMCCSPLSHLSSSLELAQNGLQSHVWRPVLWNFRMKYKRKLLMLFFICDVIFEQDALIPLWQAIYLSFFLPYCISKELTLCPALGIRVSLPLTC